MGFRFTWFGTKGFFVTRPIPERAYDSSHLFPSTVMVPLGKSLWIMSVMGPSLQTLQHHLKSLAGGPKVSTFSQNPSLPWAMWILFPCARANLLTYSTDSGNSSPVSMYRRSGESTTWDASP